ncbi:hypothetical protein DQM08_07660 [Lactiplantibacillus paraplantarum]|nr:hypothetical protein DQM08_07660 [Lactiplantibacillus paraplantarum]
MIKTCHFLNSKAASLDSLETVRVSVNLFGRCVLNRLPVGTVFEWRTCVGPTFGEFVIVFHKQ